MRATSRWVVRSISVSASVVSPVLASADRSEPGTARRQTRARNLAHPSIPKSSQSTSSCGGLTWRWARRRASAPWSSRISSGATRLPLDLDILVPPRRIIPWVKSRWNGSRSPAGATPTSARALVKKRAYMRWRMACSTPPMYWSTGSQRAAASGEKGASSFHGSANRRKYQDESTKVSMVSVSRRAGPPQAGHEAFRKPSWVVSGDCPVGMNSTSSGRSTGSWPTGTGCSPQPSQ